MKKFAILFVFAVVLLISGPLSAQSLYFCEGVDNNGNPITPSSVFNIPRDGGYFYFLVRLPYEVGCSSVSYEIYEVDYYGNETYNTIIYQDDMKTNWTWFWKKVTFYTPGKYHIYVRDCFDYVMTSDYVTIQYK